MKVEHRLEPLMQIKEKSDNIQTYGCLQVNLAFMLKPIDVINQREFLDMVTAMMKAACDVIEAKNKEGESCLGTSPMLNPEDTISSGQQQEKSSDIPPPNITLS